jgi:hypothetical protein
MKARKIYQIFVALVFLITTTLPSHAANSVDRSWWPNVPSLGFSSTEAFTPGVREKSWVSGYSYAEGASSGLYTRTVSCLSVDDPACANADSIAANFILPPCELNEGELCVDSLQISNPNGKLEPATLGYEVPSAKFAASKNRGTPFGGGISLWHSKSTLNALGVNQFAVHVHLDLQNMRNKACLTDAKSCSFELGNFSANVFPIKLRPSNTENQCLWIENGSCAAITDFLPGTKVALTVRMDNSLTGFLFGRMQDVSMEVTPLSKTLNALRVEASPIDVPSIHAFVGKSDLPKYPDLVKYWNQRRANLAAADIASAETIDLGPWPQYAMSDFLAFNKLVQSGELVTSIWRFGSGLGVGSGSDCYKDKSKILGLVTTNAPTYDPAPPAFDGAFLNYRVGGAHFLADEKTLFKGSYDLALRSEFARCLYGFSSAPLSASISVVSSEGGVQDIATESLRQDANGEWLYLNAKNFTFSSPTIRIKLIQNVQVVNSVKPVAKTTSGTKQNSVRVSSTTIKCMKGKSVKKVSGVKPKCPSGYRKI